MSNVLLRTICSRSLSQKLITAMAFAAIIFISPASALAQKTTTFPSSTSCTSNDLSLVSASTVNPNECTSCVGGDSVYRTLRMAINNKTGSTRTSFAFWGSLVTYSAAGVRIDSVPINGCGGSITANAITTIPMKTLGYKCGERLVIKNLFLAWTDANSKSTCATINSALIAPKCGTLGQIEINTGLSATATPGTPTCSQGVAALGSASVVPSGGKSPYTVSWTGPNSFTSTSLSISNLSAGSYSVQVTDANNCKTSWIPVTVTEASAPTAPTLSVVAPSFCSATGSVTVTNPEVGLQYSIDSGSNWTTYSSGALTFASLAAGSNPVVKVKNATGCISSTTAACTTTVIAPPAITEVVTSAKLGTATLESELQISAAPNPFDNNVRFTISSKVSERATLELYNINGQKVRTLFEGYIRPGKNYFDLNLNGNAAAEYIYKLRTGSAVKTGKLVRTQ